MDPRAIPDSLKDLSSLVDACGWETDAQRMFDGKECVTRCYIIPYKWKQTPKALKYNTNVTEITTRQKEIANLY
jgi:hypothetical protein